MKINNINDIPLSYKKIEKLISSDESVVGIDAKKTHIIIIHMLKEMSLKIEDMDQRLGTLEQEIKKKI